MFYIPTRKEEGEYNKANIKSERDKGFIEGLEQAIKSVEEWKNSTLFEIDIDLEEIEETDLEKVLLRTRRKIVEELAEEIKMWIDDDADEWNCILIQEQEDNCEEEENAKKEEE